MLFRPGIPLLGITVALSTSVMMAQQPAGTDTPPATVKADAVTLSAADAKAVFAAAKAAYYQPDDLSGISCRATIGWDAVAKQLGQTAPSEKLAAVKNMTIEVEAVRGQDAKFQYSWQGVPPANREQLEDSSTQMLRGLFQMYWGFADGMVPNHSDAVQVQATENAGHLLLFKNQGASTTTELDADAVPTKLSVDSPALKATVIPHFTPSPQPEPGDLRRLTSMDVSEQFGATTIKLGLTMDYQYIQGFNIPQHVGVDMVGAFNLPIEFTACSTSKR